MGGSVDANGQEMRELIWFSISHTASDVNGDKGEGFTTHCPAETARQRRNGAKKITKLQLNGLFCVHSGLSNLSFFLYFLLQL